jgi:hypothetical protein
MIVLFIRDQSSRDQVIRRDPLFMRNLDRIARTLLESITALSPAEHRADPARELPIIAELMNETRGEERVHARRADSTVARSDRHVI